MSVYWPGCEFIEDRSCVVLANPQRLVENWHILNTPYILLTFKEKGGRREGKMKGGNKGRKEGRKKNTTAICNGIQRSNLKT